MKIKTQAKVKKKTEGIIGAEQKTGAGDVNNKDMKVDEDKVNSNKSFSVNKNCKDDDQNTSQIKLLSSRKGLS